MLTNTIAEIRTYGEGFVIVDQSPSSVDIAAIKNTNTKFVLRIPEANDREAVGRSIGLTEDQVNEWGSFGFSECVDLSSTYNDILS